MMKRNCVVKQISYHSHSSRLRLIHNGPVKDDDYEIDLITMTKRAKVKSAPEQPKKSKKDLSDIINVSRPIPIQKNKLTGNSESAQSAFISPTKTSPPSPLSHLVDIKSDITKLETSLSHSFSQLEDMIKNISEEKSTSTHLINDLKARIKEVEQDRIKDAQELSGLKDEKQHIQIKAKELEKFLQNAQCKKQLEDEEHFRESRAYESSLAKTRSLNQQNFFNPVDDKLIRKVRRGTYPKLENKDDLLFPVIPRFDDRIHEFMILNKSSPIITKENPLGTNYHKPDLLTLMRSLGSSSHDKYWKTILKHEKEHWNLIGVEGYDLDDKVLIFERSITSDDLKKLERQKYMRYGYYGVVVLFLAGLGLEAQKYFYNRGESDHANVTETNGD